MSRAKKIKRIQEIVLTKYNRNLDASKIIAEIAAANGVPEKNWETLVSINAQLDCFLEALNLSKSNRSEIEQVINGMKVLELACGGHQANPDNKKDRSMEPWRPRLLAHLGADVTGVDIIYPKPYIKKGKRIIPVAEPDWTFVQKDLMKPDDLASDLPYETYDAIACNAFILNDDIRADFPDLGNLKLRDPKAYHEIAQKFVNNVRALLAKGGFLLINDSVYRKEDENIELEKHVGPLTSDLSPYL